MSLPDIPIPKVKPGQSTVPSYTRSATVIAGQYVRQDIGIANLDITNFARSSAKTSDVIRTLMRANPDLSGAAAAYIRTGIPEKYKLIARNDDGTLNVKATKLAMSLARRMESSPDYLNGFTQISTLRSIAESLGMEILKTGSMGMELVLDDNLLPLKFQPVSTSQILWFPADVQKQPKQSTPAFQVTPLYLSVSQREIATSLRPIQRIAGVDTDLDIPTFFYTALDADLMDAYSHSPFESAVQPVLAATTFLEDLRRVCQRHVYPRYDVKIDEAKLRTRIPANILNDTDALNAYLNSTIAEVENEIANLGVEQALIHFDFITVEYINGGTNDVPDTFETVKDIFDGKIATGAKTLPSILGHGSGSQNIASTETMMFLISANGMIRIKLQEIFSKAFTLALRLFGLEVSVSFAYDTIELRPESELTSFRVMHQSKILEQLSYGFITDEEASLEITGNLPPAGFKPLSGTGFFQTQGATWGPALAANPLGNQQGALGQGIAPKTPQEPKGPAKADKTKGQKSKAKLFEVKNG